MEQENQVHTFKKTNCDVWADRPRLIAYEVSRPGKWVSSINRLKRFQQIVQIVPFDISHKSKAKIEFIFYSEKTLHER